jgi:putative flavoprotein involved in K+ transport
MLLDRIETIIVGGGQAGLAVSYWLKQHGREHIVLERADRPGHAWRQRWDSFTLVTPNWTFRLPGAEYAGDDRDGFMPRDEVIARFERYVVNHDLPVSFGVDVAAVEPLADRPGYRIRTDAADFAARNVVIATGLYQRAKIPAFAAGLPPDVLQLPSESYRNPAALPPGAVLVVGSGQSGCQIAEELLKSGRRVFLSVGGAGRAPRRYRGKDTYEWLTLAGFFDRTPDKLPSSRARFAANPHLSGAGGGHDLNLHQFARDGMTLLGHLRGAEDGWIGLAGDLHESLTKCDQFEAMVLGMIDGYIARAGLVAPEGRPAALRDGYDQPIITELDVRAAGITMIIWAAGYTFDFSLVRLPVTDGDGFPVQQRGVTSYPGLYFVGLPWLHTQKSGLLLGVGEDAAFIAEHIARVTKPTIT